MNTTKNDSDARQSSEALEREVDQARARLYSKANQLSDRLSPGQLLDQSLHMVRDNAGEFGHNLGMQVRQNPIPLIITGVGIAWMMLALDRNGYPKQGYQTSLKQRGDDTAEHSDYLEAAKDRFQGAAENAEHLRDAVKDRANTTAHQIRHQSEHTKYQLQSFLHEQPIIAGGLGMALGAFLGSLLPSTDIEHKTLGHARDEVVTKAAEVANEEYDEVKEQTKDVVDKAKTALDKTGREATSVSTQGSTDFSSETTPPASADSPMNRSSKGPGLTASTTPGDGLPHRGPSES